MRELSEVEKIMGEFEFHTFECEFGTLPYRLYVPEKKSENEKYPLIVFMHGAGERGTDNILPLRAALPVFCESNPCVRNAVFLVPQCPEEEQWVATPWYEGSYSINNVPETWENKSTVLLIEHTAEALDIDRDRIYVMGLSMGGYASWDLMMRHPDIFACGMPICGGADPESADRIKDIPIRTFHGDSDESVPVSGTREMTEALEKLGTGNIRYTEYPGIGHWSWDLACSSEGIGEWMMSQRKKRN